MKQPEITRKPFLVPIFALAMIALLVFLATGALVLGTNSLADPDDILSSELNILKSNIDKFQATLVGPGKLAPTQISPESRSIHPKSGGSNLCCRGMEVIEE